MNDVNRRSRINFSVKTKMQIRLFIKVLGIIIVGVGLMAAVFYFYSDREINSSYRQFHIHADNFLDLLRPAVISSLALALIASIVITLFLPIKIAGPLFRIERDLKEKVAKGDLTVRFKLRKGDEVCELAEALNTCLEDLRQKIESVKKSAEELDSSVSGLKDRADNSIINLTNKLNRELKEFKL